MGEERHKSNRLVATAGVLEEAVIEGGAVGEEVVDLAGLHVVGEPRDEEREHALPLWVRVRRIHVVGVHRRRGGRETMGEAHAAHLGAPRRRMQSRFRLGRVGRRRRRGGRSLLLSLSLPLSGSLLPQGHDRTGARVL